MKIKKYDFLDAYRLQAKTIVIEKIKDVPKKLDTLLDPKAWAKHHPLFSLSTALMTGYSIGQEVACQRKRFQSKKIEPKCEDKKLSEDQKRNAEEEHKTVSTFSSLLSIGEYIFRSTLSTILLTLLSSPNTKEKIEDRSKSL